LFIKAQLKRIIPRNLFGRSLLIIVMPLIFVQCALFYSFWDRHTETIVRSSSANIAGTVAVLIDMIENSPQIPPLTEPEQSNGGIDKIKNYAINCFQFKKADLLPIGALSNAVKKSSNKKESEYWLYLFFKRALKAKIKNNFKLSIKDGMFHINILTNKGLLRLEIPRKNLLSTTTMLVFIFTGVSAMVFFIIASLFMRNQIRPIIRLAEAAESFGKGNENVSFRIEGATEVRKTGIAFQIMKDRLKRHLTDRLEMLAGISHDLRTPLTRMRLEIAMMPEGKTKNHLEDDVRLMRQMIETFLAHAHSSETESHQKIDIGRIIQDIVVKFQSIDFEVSISAPSRLVVNLKRQLFYRCIENIIVNAKRHAKKVMVTVSAHSGYLQIVIEDDGPGIPEEERENIFNPFYRLDAARVLGPVIGYGNIQTMDGGAGGAGEPSVGLGLSIAKDAVLSHGGKISAAQSLNLGGAKFIIELPF